MNTVEQIIDAVSIVTGVNYPAMQTPSRKREIVEARFIAAHIMKTELPELNEKAISMYFRRDRTTIIHALQTTADLLQTDKGFIRKYNECLKIFEESENNGTYFDSYSKAMLQMQMYV